MPSHHENHQPLSHLVRTRLELKKIINIARGASVEDWPPDGEWLIRFKMLKDAIEDGDLPARFAPLAPRHSSVRLVDVLTFLAKQQGRAKWDWLREFCEVWSEESGGVNDERSEAGQPEHGPSAVCPNRRGRKEGIGGYDSADMPLIEEMHRLIEIEEVTGPWNAALKVVDEAPGRGVLDSKLKRLTRKYEAKYGPSEGHSD